MEDAARLVEASEHVTGTDKETMEKERFEQDDSEREEEMEENDEKEEEEGEEEEEEEDVYMLQFDGDMDPLGFAQGDNHGVELYQQFERLEYEALAERKRKAIHEKEQSWGTNPSILIVDS